MPKSGKHFILTKERFESIYVSKQKPAAKYTLKHAEMVLFFVKKTIASNAVLIGSLGKGRESDHDIDIHIPLKKTNRLVDMIKYKLEAESCQDTDWGGVYFKNTFYGDIDVFFKGNTDEFDY